MGNTQFRACALALVAALPSCASGSHEPSAEPSGHVSTAWSEPERVSFAMAESVPVSALTWLEPGRAQVVWRELEAGTVRVWGRPYSVELGFGDAVSISDGASDVWGIELVADQNGNAWAVWVEGDQAGSRVVTSRYEAGIGWNAVESIGSDGPVFAGRPQIALDADANAVAVWLDSNSHRLFWNRYGARSGWGSEAVVYQGEQQLSHPLLASNARGDVMMKFNTGESYENTFSVSYRADTGWNEPESALAGAPLILASNGDAMTFSTNQLHPAIEITSGYYTKTGGWQSTGFARTPSSAFFYGDYAAAAFDPAGSVHAVARPWGQFPMVAARYRADSGWTATEDLELAEDTSGSDADPPRVATNDNGAMVAAWRRTATTGATLWLSRMPPYGEWQTPTSIPPAACELCAPSITPSVAIDGDGNVLAIWLEEAAGTWGLWASLLRAEP